MRTKYAFVLLLIALMFAASCDSSETVKYLEFKSDVLLPQAPIGENYEFTFTVTYGEDKWDASTGFVESEIIWGFDNWKLNGADKSAGPANMTFSEGMISGTPDSADGGLWSFDVTIQKGKKIVIEKFYLPMTQNVEIVTNTVLPTVTTDTDFSMYFDASFGSKPYYWSYDNWTKNGSPVNNPPSGLALTATGYVSGKADHSEAGVWTFDVTVFDTSVPKQLTTTKTFEMNIALKLEVPTNYPTIQAAVDIAKKVDTIYLTAGTYKGAGNRDINFNGKSLTILGNPQDPSTVIIDCEGTSSTPHRAFTLKSAEKDCVIDGLTIMNGSALKDGSNYYAGAIYLGSSVGLTVQNTNIKDIITTQTGSGYIYGGAIYTGTNCELTLKNVKAENIEASLQYTSSSAYLEGLFIRTNNDTVFTMEDCVIDGGFGEASYYRGLLYLYYTTYELNNCVVKNIHSSTCYYLYNYGMFYLYYSAGTFNDVSVVNNRFAVNKTNSTSYSYGYIYSIGYFYYNDIVLNNFVFANNVYGTDDPSDSYYYIYGVYTYYGTSKWNDCIFAMNEADTSYTSDVRVYGLFMRPYYQLAEFNRCLYIQNTVMSTYSGLSYSYGGAVNVYYGDAIFNDCVFAYNNIRNGCAGIQAGYNMTCTVNNTTLAYNSGYYGGAMMYYYATTINNSILWGNTSVNSGNQIYGYSSSYQLTMYNTLYSNQSGDISGGNINPVSCVNTDPYFKDTNSNPVTGDCTFSDVDMKVVGTPGTSQFMSEIMRGDLIFLTSDGETSAVVVVEVVSDTELKVGGYYKGSVGTGPATVKKTNFNLQHTSKGDANDSPCVDSGDNSRVSSSQDVAGNTRIVDGNGDTTPTVDMGAYELQ